MVEVAPRSGPTPEPAQHMRKFNLIIEKTGPDSASRTKCIFDIEKSKQPPCPDNRADSIPLTLALLSGSPVTKGAVNI